MPENEFRYADFKEVREGANGLSIVVGIVIRYRERATLPWGTEEFLPGAFGAFQDTPVYANRMHERSQPLGWLGKQLVLDDDEVRLESILTLPDTTYGRDVAVEVKDGILKGESLEFRVIEDTVNQDTAHRVISKAKLYGFGIVDQPAYSGSLAAMRSWNEYRLAHGYTVPEVENRDEPRELATVHRFLVA